MSYTWITPKTDWVKSSHFTYIDYNRIRNNLLYLNDQANTLYPDVAKELDLGSEKTGYGNDYFPTEFMNFEDALESLTRIGVDVNIGDRSYYYGNSEFILADALNRLENCCIRWKDYFDSTAYFPVESITVTPSIVTLNYWETKSFSVSVQPVNATKKNEWEVPQVNPFVAARIDNTTFTLKDVLGVAGMYQRYEELQVLASDVFVNIPYRTYETAEENYAVVVYDPNILLSNRVVVTLPSTGSYYVDTSNKVCYYLFQLIGNDIDNANYSTLLNVGTGCKAKLYDGDNRADSSEPWRTAYAGIVNTNFSSDLKNAMLDGYKKVHVTKDSIALQAAKYHLLSADEIGITDSHITPLVLGSKTYPYLINNPFKIIYYASQGRGAYQSGIALRSQWDSGSARGLPPYDGVYSVVLDNTLGNKSVYYTYDESDNVCPMIFVSKTTHVLLETTKNGYEYYSIDWTGESDTTLADIPLGSYIYDSRGYRGN